MRSLLVVIRSPLIRPDPGSSNRKEQSGTEVLLPKPAVERPDACIYSQAFRVRINVELDLV